MRVRSFGLLSCGVFAFGAALAACGSSGDDSAGAGGFPAAGAAGVAGATSSAGAGNAVGAPGTAGAAQGGASGGGASSVAGAAGSDSLAGSSGANNSAGSGGDAAGVGGSAGTAGVGGSAGMAGSGGTSVPALKVVVFLDDWRGSWTSWASKIDFSKMTYLNLAFFIANTSNGWAPDGQSDADVKAIVSKAHASGVKVLAALGGGGTDTTVVNQYKNPGNDDALVTNLDAMLKKFDLDGVDLDIEKESKADVGDNFASFVTKVIAKLRPEGKVVTMDTNTNLYQYANDDTLKSFDFLNLMIYSSNTADYTSELKAFTAKGIAQSALVLGIESDGEKHTSVTAAKPIIELSKGYGGPMLWDLGEDGTGSASVYKTIQDAM